MSRKKGESPSSGLNHRTLADCNIAGKGGLGGKNEGELYSITRNRRIIERRVYSLHIYSIER